MKLFVTGGSGFIGTNLLAEVTRRRIDVLNFDCRPPLDLTQRPHWRPGDIQDAAALRAALREYGPDCVVHLAARTDCDEGVTVDEGYRANSDGTANLLAAIAAAPPVRRVIITSSQFVFNRGARLPAHDEDYHPITVYGQSKVITEQLTRRAHLPCTWTIIRPTTVWGPWCRRYCSTLFKAFRRGLYVHPGRRPCLRSYGYVGNVVHQILAILAARPQDVDGRVIYVGDRPLVLLDWVDAFSLGLTGRRARVVPRWFVRPLAWAGDALGRLSGRPFLINSTRFDSMTRDYLTPMDATCQLLGEPPYSVEDGIERTIAWVREYDPSLAPAALAPGGDAADPPARPMRSCP